MSELFSCVEMVLGCDFSEEELCSVNGLCTSEASDAVINLRATSMIRVASAIRATTKSPKLTAAFSKSVEYFSKTAMKRNADLQEYRSDLIRHGELIKNDLANEAFEWANHLISEKMEMASRLCTSDIGYLYMSDGIYVAMTSGATPGINRPGGNKSKAFEKFKKRVPKIIEAVERSSFKSTLINYAIIANELFGGIDVPMVYTLSNMYVYGFIGLVLVSHGYDAAKIFGSKIDLYDDDLMRSIAEFSVLLQDCRPEAMIAGYYGRVVAEHLSISVGVHCYAIRSLCREVDALDQELNRESRAREKQLLELNETISRQQRIIEKLQKNSDDSDIKKLMIDENNRLKTKIGEHELEIHRLKRQLEKNISDANEKLALNDEQEELLPVFKEQTLANKFDYDAALSLLRERRFVIVGGHINFLSKIKDILPCWQSFSADEFSVDNAVIRGAEMIIFFTSYCSHKLTEKVMSISRKENIPVAYAYKVNPKSFLMEAYQAAMKNKLIG